MSEMHLDTIIYVVSQPFLLKCSVSFFNTIISSKRDKTHLSRVFLAIDVGRKFFNGKHAARLLFFDLENKKRERK